MFLNDVQKLSQSFTKKIEFMEKSPAGYFILSALAGIYVAFGIALILYIGAPLAAAGSPITRTIMGASFGVALTLVIFAGAELFTGNNMLGVVGALNRTTSVGQVGKLWAWCYLGNLAGSIFLAWLLAQSGLYSASPYVDFVQKVATLKMGAPFWQLFVRGILANWLVCLAVWMAARAVSESAKLALIFWCLFVFITCGFEHSVANMSSLALGLFLPHGEAVTWWGYTRNLAATSLGNIVGGGFFVGALYWMATRPAAILQTESAPQREAVPA